SAGDCFAPFPFPTRNPAEPVDALEEIGERLYTQRAKLMQERQFGLTSLYNELYDRSNTDESIAALRELHAETDRSVLAAYGWEDIDVPAFELRDLGFDDAVAGRLFALNADRVDATPSHLNDGPSVKKVRAPTSQRATPLAKRTGKARGA